MPGHKVHAQEKRVDATKTVIGAQKTPGALVEGWEPKSGSDGTKTEVPIAIGVVKK
jgi:hypothetical protein